MAPAVCGSALALALVGVLASASTLAAERATSAPDRPESNHTFHFSAGFNAGSVGWGLRLGSGLDWWPLPWLGIGLGGALEARTQVIFFADNYQSAFVGPTLSWRGAHFFASAAAGWSGTWLQQGDDFYCPAPCKRSGSGVGAVLSGGYAYPAGRVDLGFLLAYDLRTGDGAAYRWHRAGSANLVLLVPLY